MKRFYPIAIAFAALIAGAAVGVAWRDVGRPALTLYGAGDTDISGAPIGADFELIDHTGKAHRLSDFRGKAVVVFFGFTHCPDVCPTTLALLKSALAELGDDARHVRVLFITVDPERDTPAKLAQYVTAFDPRFIGLTGDAQAIATAAKSFKVIYRRNDLGGGNYSIDHSAGLFLLDREGRARILTSVTAGAEAIAANLRGLLT